MIKEMEKECLKCKEVKECGQNLAGEYICQDCYYKDMTLEEIDNTI